MKTKKQEVARENAQESAEKLSGTFPGAAAFADLMADSVQKIYADQVQLFDGFESGKSHHENLSDEGLRALMPGLDAFERKLDFIHGHDFQGRLAARAFSHMRSSVEQTENPGLLHPIYREGLCGGLLFRQLQDAYKKGDAGFFRALVGMIETRAIATPKLFDPVAYALGAKLKLEDDGKPVTKKAVRELAEKTQAEYQIRSRGAMPTPDLIKRETDRLCWDWKRTWKKHPDLEDLPKDKGGPPRKRK